MSELAAAVRNFSNFDKLSFSRRSSNSTDTMQLMWIASQMTWRKRELQ